MRTIRIKLYKFNELSKQAQDKAISDHIEFEIEVMSKKSPYFYLAEEMDRMRTPWFLAGEIYKHHFASICQTILLNEYEFTKDGKLS